MPSDSIHQALCAAFDKSDEFQRKGPGGKMLTYITARSVMNRLDEVVGSANWQTKMVDVCGNVCCELSVRLGGEWITKVDRADESDIEGVKGAYSDAFKRAAVHFGIGRYLYGGARPLAIAKVVMEQENIQVDQARVDGSVDYIRESILDERVSDAMIQWAELSRDEQIVAWSMLDSKTRAVLKRERA